MASALSIWSELVGQTVRFGWYWGLNQLVDRELDRLGARQAYRPQRPVPPTQEILGTLMALLRADAAAVGAGIYPPTEADAALAPHLARLRAMFADLPAAAQRRLQRDAGTARASAASAGVPDYFAQDFHFQTGGYLTEESARLYDVQVETLFYGAGQAMRRAALGPIARFVHGQDQRRLALLDVACGTGRFLRQVRRAYPAMRLTGLDLSQPYLDEARRHLEPLRPAALVAGNAEAPPIEDASQDIVTCIFLFHELPGEVRRRVAAEIARVLKPGGLFVFVDSLQMGDRPGWDGLLEAFPVRFHEPYYRGYAIDDLDTVFASVGLAGEASALPFLSKMMVRRRA